MMMQENQEVDFAMAVRVKRSMATNKGDLIRLADVNYEIPGSMEPGLFALPMALEDGGDVEWVLVDGSCARITCKSHIELLVKFIARTYGDKASLTDCARAFLA